MKSVKNIVCLLVLLICGVITANASVNYLNARIDNALGPNQYSLQLPPSWGGNTITVPLDSGYFTIKMDDGLNTAQMVDWRQWVGALVIQGQSSGQITVALDNTAPSTGTIIGPDTMVILSTYKFYFADSGLSSYGMFSGMTSAALETIIVTPNPDPYPYAFIASAHSAGTVQIGQENLQYDCVTSAGVYHKSDAIPTLTEWGLIIFAVLLVGFMTWVVVRRRRRVTIGI